KPRPGLVYAGAQPGLRLWLLQFFSVFRRFRQQVFRRFRQQVFRRRRGAGPGSHSQRGCSRFRRGSHFVTEGF
ncbi:MAG TPA: hypothetical protein PK442_06980, partial [Synergistales bacterium]|nr:hypothetical protein [Synergistales bacterium]